MKRDRSYIAWRLCTQLANLIAICGLITPLTASANPYLAKPGEPSVTAHVSTCANSGGFIHLYTAIDSGLFDKYGLKVDQRFISGSAMNLAALSVQSDGGRPDPAHRG